MSSIALALFMKENPNATRVLAPAIVLGYAVVSGARALWEITSGVAMTALSFLATVATFGQWDKPIENLEHYSGKAMTGILRAVGTVFYVVLSPLALIAIEISPESVGDKMLLY